MNQCPWCNKQCFNMWHWFKMWVAGYSRFSSCRLGMHRWSHPGGSCERCGKKDDFFQVTQRGYKETRKIDFKSGANQ